MAAPMTDIIASKADLMTDIIVIMVLCLRHIIVITAHHDDVP
jgi:hypothetical protein